MQQLFVDQMTRHLIPCLLPMFVLYFCMSDSTAAECGSTASQGSATSGLSGNADNCPNPLGGERLDLPLATTYFHTEVRSGSPFERQ